MLQKYSISSSVRYDNPVNLKSFQSWSTMIRFLLPIFCLLFPLFGTAQAISTCQEVIGATGGSAEKAGKFYAWTVGETAIFTLKNANAPLQLTQGFHQPDVCLPVSTNSPEQWAGWDVQVYPNPAIDYLTVQYTAPDDRSLQYSIVHTSGRVITTSQPINRDGIQILCANLPAGQYVLQVQQPDSGAILNIPFIKLDHD